MGNGAAFRTPPLKTFVETDKLQGARQTRTITYIVQNHPEPLAARRLDGRLIAAELRAVIHARVNRLSSFGKQPALAILAVDPDPAALSYTQMLIRTAERLGIRTRFFPLTAAAGEAALLELIAELGADPATDGIVVQQPLPPGFNAPAILGRINPAKDIDGSSPLIQGHLAVGSTALFTPATPRAVMEILRHSSAWPLTGKDAVVIGKSNVVGLPVSLLLLQQGATVTVTHKDTVDLAAHTRRAGILVSAAGVPGLVTAGMIRPGAVVIDVGTTVVDGELRGDVYEPAAAATAAEFTPVPGGVGPVTTAALLANVVDAAERGTAN